MSSSERVSRESHDAADEAEFELNLLVPSDVRLAATVRALVVFAAQQVGCAETVAAGFGRRVEDAVRTSFQDTLGGRLPITVRNRARVIEVVINGHTLILDA